MSDLSVSSRHPFVTTEQRDVAELTAKLIGDELEARLGPKLDAIAQLVAAQVEAIEHVAEREAGA